LAGPTRVMMTDPSSPEFVTVTLAVAVDAAA
jgi:hypothetical protein